MNSNPTVNPVVNKASKPLRNTKVHGHPGERNPRACLTEDAVRIARKLYEPYSRQWGVRALARRFGVSCTAMHHAISGKCWPHVPM